MSICLDQNPDITFLVGRSRQIVSELAFYVKGQPHVYKYTNPQKVVDSQYDLWPGPHDRIGENGLVVLKSGKVFPEGLKDLFQSVTFMKTIKVQAGLKACREFDLYQADKLEKWPRP